MTEKGKAILAYIFTWIGGLIVLYGIKDNERNTKIHAAQAIVIGVGYMVIYGIYRFIPFYIGFLCKILRRNIRPNINFKSISCLNSSYHKSRKLS